MPIDQREQGQPRVPADPGPGRMGVRLFHFLGLASRRGAWVILLPVVLALVLTLTATLLTGIRVPSIHDEHSYLLAADTFAHGRITNPTHPMWKHFETMHVIHQPSYQSMYPPAQGLALALGQILWHPILGVWLSVAAMMAAFAWMLKAWMPARWALLGALLAASKLIVLGKADLGIEGYWSQTYWGGAVAATGGALLFGAMPRIMRRPRVGTALIMVSGLAILANSRLYTGFAASLPAAWVIVVWLCRRKGSELRSALLRFVVPLAIGLSLTGAAMLYYNYRVTGDPVVVPWKRHNEQYCVFPIFMWQKPRPVEEYPEYRHEAMREFHTGWELDLYLNNLSSPKLIRNSAKKVFTIWRFFFGPLLSVPLLMLPWFLKDRGMRLAVAVCLAVIAANLLTVVVFPHYTAPAACLYFALVTQGIRHMQFVRWKNRALGPALVWVVLIGSSALMLYGLRPQARASGSIWTYYRTGVLRELQHRDGKHLVLVSYGAKHNVHNEWVFNAAEIDRAKVVWARAMNRQEDRELLDYFKGRKVWRLYIDSDEEPPKLTPYPRRPAAAQ